MGDGRDGDAPHHQHRPEADDGERDGPTRSAIRAPGGPEAVDDEVHAEVEAAAHLTAAPRKMIQMKQSRATSSYQRKVAWST